ncbi:SPW repeat protein [Streptomyces sp. M19]
MRERYARVTGGKDVFLDGPVLLAGLYLAISPWVMHFAGAHPDLRASNLIVGLCVALLGLGLTVAPTRMSSLSWAMVAIGAWTIVSPWVVLTTSPDRGIVLNNVIIGGLTCLFGLMAAGVVMRNRKRLPG